MSKNQQRQNILKVIRKFNKLDEDEEDKLQKNKDLIKSEDSMKNVLKMFGGKKQKKVQAYLQKQEQKERCLVGFGVQNPQKFVFPYQFVRISQFQIVNDQALMQNDELNQDEQWIYLAYNQINKILVSENLISVQFIPAYDHLPKVNLDYYIERLKSKGDSTLKEMADLFKNVEQFEKKGEKQILEKDKETDQYQFNQNDIILLKPEIKDNLLSAIIYTQPQQDKPFMDIHITKGFLQKIGWDHTQVIKTLIEEKKMPVWQNLYNYKLNTLKKIQTYIHQNQQNNSKQEVTLCFLDQTQSKHFYEVTRDNIYSLNKSQEYTIIQIK